MRKYLEFLWNNAAAHNLRNIMSFLEPEPSACFLDLGCDNGDLTLNLAEKVGTRCLYGVEIVPRRAEEARMKGIHVEESDLNSPLKFQDGFFDVVHANQVIEHVHATDVFVDEIYRVLKPGGYAVISTENLSSWHNIAALLFGWQPFSLTNVSSCTLGLGNPLALLRGQSHQFKSWEHIRVFSYRGLKELFASHGFLIRAVLGAGYYPLLSTLATWDPYHAAFLTMKVRKESSEQGKAAPAAQY